MNGSHAFPESRAVIYCEGAFAGSNGKTAHGLVRRSLRYQVLSVVDSRSAGADAGMLLDGRPAGIPILSDIGEAVWAARLAGAPATHLVMGLAPDGGRIPPEARQEVRRALEMGLNVDSGLHDLLGDDPELTALAAERGLVIRDIRRTPPREELHPFTGLIERVDALRVAILGTDSAIGKRTTAWELVDGLDRAGHRAVMVGTGQTAWLQGAEYGVIMDALINDFVSGEIEYAVWRAWKETDAEVIVIEGQGSLMNPAYPGGFEILAAGRPHAVILQHAPARREYDGFPGYPLHSLERQIRAIECVSECPVAAVTINHEGMSEEEIPAACREISRATGLPAADPLRGGMEEIVALLGARIPEKTH
jgi:uncharacterized NAD-dependent epimerase/dehydratase family protein